MTPLAVKKLFSHHNQLTLSQIKDYFMIDQSVAKQLTDFWQRRGALKVIHCQVCAKQCVTKVYYQWQSSDAAISASE